MNKFIIVDARMGRGKSTAAFRYINENKENRRFMYVTPYLKEVERACYTCELIQPSDEIKSKLASLIEYMHRGKNVAFTHELFKYLNDQIIEMVKEKNYNLIIDESIEVSSQLEMTQSDVVILPDIIDISQESGKVSWKYGEYSGGMLQELYTAVTQKEVYYTLGKYFSLINPEIFRAFDSIHMLTYLFEGTEFEAYLKMYSFEYKIVGIAEDEAGVMFSDRPDNPPPLDLKSLITIVDNHKWNEIGEKRNALSKNWYLKHCTSKSSYGARVLGKQLHAFFRHKKGEKKSGKQDRMWCVFSDHMEYVSQACTPKNRARYVEEFVSLNTRATNEYSSCTKLAYMVNRFANPNIKKFYASLGYEIDEDQLALSEMVQWVWRSAIRKGEPITVYIPSSRMRNLFVEWIDRVSSNPGECESCTENENVEMLPDEVTE